MKRYIRCQTDKTYDVIVYSRRAKGSYNSRILQSWSLDAHSLSKAKAFGYDVLAGLSMDEIFENKKEKFKDIYDKIVDEYNIDEYDPIGYDVAEKEFLVKSFKL